MAGDEHLQAVTYFFQMLHDVRFVSYTTSATTLTIFTAIKTSVAFNDCVIPCSNFN